MGDAALIRIAVAEEFDKLVDGMTRRYPQYASRAATAQAFEQLEASLAARALARQRRAPPAAAEGPRAQSPLARTTRKRARPGALPGAAAEPAIAAQKEAEWFVRELEAAAESEESRLLPAALARRSGARGAEPAAASSRPAQAQRASLGVAESLGFGTRFRNPVDADFSLAELFPVEDLFGGGGGGGGSGGGGIGVAMPAPAAAPGPPVPRNARRVPLYA